MECVLGLASGNDLISVVMLASGLQWPSSTVRKLRAWNWPSKGRSTPFHRVQGMLGYLPEKWMELCTDHKVNVSVMPGWEAPLGYHPRESKLMRERAREQQGNRVESGS